MAKSKRHLFETAQETATPPPMLKNGHLIAKVVKNEGNNLWSVEEPRGEGPLLVELPARFRSTIWMKRGGFVVVDTTAFEDRENKLRGEIVNVVREEKQWRKQAYWLVPGNITDKCVFRFASCTYGLAGPQNLRSSPHTRKTAKMRSPLLARCHPLAIRTECLLIHIPYPNMEFSVDVLADLLMGLCQRRLPRKVIPRAPPYPNHLHG